MLMKRLQLCLETSVWNFFFADDAPEKREVTVALFRKIAKGAYEIFISDLAIKEIGKAAEGKRRELLGLIKKYQPKRLIVDETVVELARQCIAEGVLPLSKEEDAIHATVATVFEIDALISWNLTHLANLKKMEMINGINLKEGYRKKLELITQMEVSDDEVRSILDGGLGVEGCSMR
jgi:hypothetical protein